MDNREVYLVMLAYAFVDIRAADGDEPEQHSRAIADIFHHVPEALTLPWTQDRDDRVWQQIVAKAKVYGLTDKVFAWRESARLRCAKG